MLAQHKFYVYHEGAHVMARILGRTPVVAETFDTPQAAHDKVQSILNPEGLVFDVYGPLGFLAPAFQAKISERCEDYVRAAYGETASPARPATRKK